MRSRGEGVSDLIHVLPGSFLLLLLDFTHFLDPFPALDCRKPLFWNGVISVIQSGQSTGDCTNGVGIRVYIIFNDNILALFSADERQD